MNLLLVPLDRNVDTFQIRKMFQVRYCRYRPSGVVCGVVVMMEEQVMGKVVPPEEEEKNENENKYRIDFVEMEDDQAEAKRMSRALLPRRIDPNDFRKIAR